MSHRLRVVIPEDLDARIAQAAQRNGLSKGEWVRRILETALGLQDPDPLDRLSALGAPTADIEPMLAQIAAGRR